MFLRSLAVVVLFVSVTAFAAGFDGVYKFSSRTKEGAPDLKGWWGTMIITNSTMSRVFLAPDGKTEKFYVGELKPTGDMYSLKLTQAYKPEYIGNVHKNKITWVGSSLVIESDDGKFKEVWTKK